MIDKEKICEEVERLKLCTMDEHMKFYSEAAEAEYNALCNIEYFIDSLQEEPASEDLEEAATKYAQDKYLPVQTAQSFKAGAEWQKEQMIGKACEWLKENKDHPLIGCEDPCLSGYLTDEFIEDFKKAIEE